MFFCVHPWAELSFPHLPNSPGANPRQSMTRIRYLWPPSLSLHLQFINLPTLVIESLFPCSMMKFVYLPHSLCDTVLLSCSTPQLCSPSGRWSIFTGFLPLLHTLSPWKDLPATPAYPPVIGFHRTLELRSTHHHYTQLTTWIFTSPSKYHRLHLPISSPLLTFILSWITFVPSLTNCLLCSQFATLDCHTTTQVLCLPLRSPSHESLVEFNPLFMFKE